MMQACSGHIAASLQAVLSHSPSNIGWLQMCSLDRCSSRHAVQKCHADAADADPAPQSAVHKYNVDTWKIYVPGWVAWAEEA